MLQSINPNLRLPLVLLVGLVALLLLVAGLRGWLVYGTAMLLAAAEGGLSWCF